MRAPCLILALGLTLVSGGASAAAPAAAAADFEVPAEASPANLLPAALASGETWQVADPVRSDGLMRLYVLESRFGRFEAYGQFALALRVREAEALAQLARTSTLAVVAGGVSRGVVREVGTVASVATHPFSTVIGIPKGIAHLFHGYVAQGRELAGQAKQAAGRTSGQGSGTAGRDGSPGAARAALDKGTSAARHYADRYLGLSDAERRWYRKLGVDPYTDNRVLREAVHRVARVDAAANFGMRFVALPEVAGVALAGRTLDAIYNEDPAVIRAREHDTLAGFGLTPAELERWQDSLLLSPTRQVFLFTAAQALDGVEGRAELFRHAMDLSSESEAQVYVQSVGLLVAAHHAHPLAAVLPGVRLPAARRADGQVVVCGAFDAVYWTAEVAAAERAIREALPPQASSRELWFAGPVSSRARSEFEQAGWRILESTGAPETQLPGTM